ncbi:MAG TPA: septal ring lytic transglycosylase RlpA family protein [Alphaproteobacteria bacterium]
MRIPFSRVIALALVAGSLAACSETEFLMNTAKQVRGRDTAQTPTTGGLYKIGNPYQISGVWYYPAVDYDYDETGIASWYGPDFHGKVTANGEEYDMNAMTAAHRTLPMPSIVQVTNLENGRSVTVRVNDRGPYARGRIIDLSRRAAQLLGVEKQGTAKVRVQVLSEESRILAAQLTGKDDTGIVAVNGVKGAPRAAVESADLAPPPGVRAAPGPAPAHPAAAPAPSAVTALAQPVQVTEAVKQVPVKPTGIFIQAGAFADYNNANRQKVLLSSLGPASITQVTLNNQQPLFRVRLGPIASVGEADKLLERVSASGFPDARMIVD